MSSLQRLRQDLVYAWRGLLGSPTFALIAVFTLAIGIAANATLFSMFDALVLHPYGVDTSDLVVAAEKPPTLEFYPTSLSTIEDWRSQTQTFRSLATVSFVELNWVGQGEPDRILGYRVSPELFELLPLQPRLGRLFTPEENRDPHLHPILLSHWLWESRLGADPGIVGKELVLNQTRYTVVGVERPGIRFPHGAQFWVPLIPTPAEKSDRELRASFSIGQLRPKLSIADAQAELSAAMMRAYRKHPDLDLYQEARVFPMSEAGMVSRTRLIVMMSAAIFVLLIACANVANMLLARASQREREIAIRSALGASRPRIVRQLLTESFLLAFVSGVLGVVIALWTVDALRSIYPPAVTQFVSGFDQLRVSPRVIGFSFILSCATALLFGLAPALRLSSLKVQQVLQREAKSLTPSRVTHRFRNGLVIVETALALLLVVTALLTARSFQRLTEESAAFHPNTLITAVVSSPPSHPSSEFLPYVDESLTRLAKLEGVESVAATMMLPLAYNFSDFPLEIEGQSTTAGGGMRVAVNLITPQFFDTLGVRMLEGVGFSSRPAPGGERVAVVSESFARDFFPGQNALGRRIRISPQHSPGWVRIIGVVPGVRYRIAADDSQRMVYLSLGDQGWQPVLRRVDCEFAFFLRTKEPLDPLIRRVRSELTEIDPTKTISEIAPLSKILEAVGLSGYRATSLVTGILALVALFLAAIGIYGVVSYTVSLRTQEIGIRLALGTSNRSLVRWILWQGMLPCLIGVAIGSGASFFASGLMGKMLFAYSRYDVPTALLVTLTLMFVALSACLIPARAALRIDPSIAMRAN